MSSNEEKSTVDRLTIHKARLRALVQALELAEIKIPLDRHGTNRLTTYGESENSDYPLKELLIAVWQDPDDSPFGASVDTIDKLFKDFETITDKRPEYLGKTQLRFILQIKCTFLGFDGVENERSKWREKYFFNYRYYKRNPGPTIEKSKLRISSLIEELFLGKLKQTPNSKFSVVKNYVKSFERTLEQRDYRYKRLANKVFIFLRNRADKEVLEEVRDNLILLFEKHGSYDDNMEDKGFLLPDYRDFEKLSNSNIELGDSEREKIAEIGFEQAFNNSNQSFDGLRYQKIDYWQSKLENIPVEDWPKGFIEHVLLTNIEYHAAYITICEVMFNIRDKLKYEIYFSLDGDIVGRTRTEYNFNNLCELLTKYEFNRSAFSIQLQNDGNLLQERLQRIDNEKMKRDSANIQSILDKLINNYLMSKISNLTGFKLDKSKDYIFR